MKNIIKHLLSFVLVFAMIFPSTIAFAENISDLKNEQEEIQNEINNKNKSLNETRDEIEEQLEEMKELDKEVSIEQDKLNTINEKITIIQNNLDATTERLATAEAERDSKYYAFKERIASMYEYGRYPYISLLFSSDNISEFLINAKYLSSIAKYDREIVEELNDITIQIENDKQKIEEDKAKQIALKNEQQSTINNLQHKIDEKNNLIDKLYATEAGFEASIKKLENDDAEIERKLQDYYSSQNTENGSSSGTSSFPGGKLAWPAPGYYTITSDYGYRVHPISGTTKFHKGIDISVPTGNAIVSAESGTVVSANWMNGYGNTVVVDHGGGLSTLYAHNSSISVSNGQHVDRGQKIASSGSTGQSTGPHLHFEVRINGSTTDPKAYLY